MKKRFKNIFNYLSDYLFWVVLTIILVFVYKHSFSSFFFGDDFYNLSLVQGKSFSQILESFNLFKKGPQNFLFYRPLTTQLFFWLGFKVFGLNPLGWRLVLFLFFYFSVFLVFWLAEILFRKKEISFLTTFFYAISGSHFYRLFFLSQFQEVGLAFFYLLSVILFVYTYREDSFLLKVGSLIFFIIALTCKETAVTLPLVLFLIYWLEKSRSSFFSEALKKILPYFVISIIYLLLRIFIFGFVQGGDYNFVFSFRSICNSSIWYFLWILGVPEDFVNLSLLVKPIGINLRFFDAFGQLGAAILFFLGLFIFSLLIGVRCFLSKQKKHSKIIFFSVLWFLITLAPVLFFPFHKFAYSTTLPLFGGSVLIAFFCWYLLKFSRFFFFSALVFYIFSFNLAFQYNWQNHWSIKRSRLAEKIVNSFQTEHFNFKEGKNYYFYDVLESLRYCPLKNKFWSQEISYALSNEKALEVVYQKDLQIYYQRFLPVYKLKRSDNLFIYSKSFFEK